MASFLGESKQSISFRRRVSIAEPFATHVFGHTLSGGAATVCRIELHRRGVAAIDAT
jgi:hypothetical protein